MRQALRWTVALSLGLAAGCGPRPAGVAEERAATRASDARDLTLRSAAAPPAIAVASPVELGRPETPRRQTSRRRSVPRPAPARSEIAPKAPAAEVPEPVAVLAPAPAPVAVAAIDMAAAVEPAPAPNDRELAPGETVMVIPASSGPADGGIGDVALPTQPGRAFAGGARGCPHPPRGIGGGRPIGISRLP